MNLIPTWPFVAGALVIGLAGGAYVDHAVMSSKADKVAAAHAEELRLREVQRAKDEKVARDRETGWVQKLNDAEQRRIDENLASSNAADALRQRLRNQAASKPTNPSGLPQASASCETASGAVVSESVGNNLVALAQRADELRAALSTCYQAYDSVSQPSNQKSR